MPLVSPSQTTVVKLSLPEDCAQALQDYAKWANASKTDVVCTALTRLFAADQDWQAKCKEAPCAT